MVIKTGEELLKYIDKVCKAEEEKKQAEKAKAEQDMKCKIKQFDI